MILFACSGPGALDAIRQNIEVACDHALLVGGLGVLSLMLSIGAGRRRWIFPGVLGMLLALHPAWTISAYGGDCGATKVEAAGLVSGAAAVAIVVQAMLRAGLAIRRGRALARHGPNDDVTRRSD